MEKQTARWGVAWGILAIAIIAVVSFGSRFPFGQLASAMVFFVAAATLILVRPIIKRSPLNRRIVVDRSRNTFVQKILLPVGVLSICAAFIWILVLARNVPNSDAGVVILFVPSITLLVVGVAAIAFRVYIWFFGS
ncbi:MULTISPECIES: hypothetical protein [unclassified Caulobacter]|uniref:hypothetical protein n=1 Tax=unclassified Caulobacter TaxID=2648921 RepID=UPI0012E3E7F5|nr:MULTISPECIES: hypothetical protein [unclassified Caulobacter]